MDSSEPDTVWIDFIAKKEFPDLRGKEINQKIVLNSNEKYLLGLDSNI